MKKHKQLPKSIHGLGGLTLPRGTHPSPLIEERCYYCISRGGFWARCV